MRKRAKRLTALILVLSLTMSLLSSTAWAEELVEETTDSAEASMVEVEDEPTEAEEEQSEESQQAEEPEAQPEKSEPADKSTGQEDSTNDDSESQRKDESNAQNNLTIGADNENGQSSIPAENSSDSVQDDAEGQEMLEIPALEDSVEQATIETEQPVNDDEALDISEIDDPENDEILTYAVSDYKAWAQSDSRWGSIKMGTSGSTISAKGCLVTSVTKLIIQAGFKNSSSFNVATLANWLNANNGYSGASLYWAKPSQYVNGFNYSGVLLGNSKHSSSSYESTLLNYIKKGYHIVLNVKNGSHWVAIDENTSIATGRIYIMDSLKTTSTNSGVLLSSRYSEFLRAVAYTGGTTPSSSSSSSASYTTGVYSVTASSLNVRSGPSTSYTSKGVLSKGSTISIVEISGVWGRYLDGWVSLKYCSYQRSIADVRVSYGISTTHGKNFSSQKVSSMSVGETYYFCCNILDENGNVFKNKYSCDYTIYKKIYDPSGNLVKYTKSSNFGLSYLTFTPTQTGTYKFQLLVSGVFDGAKKTSSTVEWSLNCSLAAGAGQVVVIPGKGAGAIVGGPFDGISVNLDTYFIHYDANGGVNAPDSQEATANLAVTLSKSIPECEGYTFIGWSTDYASDEYEYLAGDSYTGKEETYLYAIWHENAHKSVTIKGKIIATCNSDGYTGDSYCTTCGMLLKRGSVVAKNQNHTWNSGKVTTAATCVATGVKTYTCTVCGTTKTETIAKDSSNHTGGTEVKNAVSATCGKAGYTGDTYCKSCGAKIKTGTTISATGKHTWDSGKVTTVATCIATGVKTYTCTICSKTKTETIAKNSSNHTGGTEVKNAASATCSKAGYTGDTYCKGCGTKIKTGTTISATGKHTWDSGKVTKAATCIATGIKTYTCTVCSTTKTESIAKNSSNHTGGTEVKNAVSATCSKVGYTGDTYCKSCGTKIKTGMTISATENHTWDDGEDTKNPSFTATGTTTYTCTVCGETKTETIAKLTKVALNKATVTLSKTSVAYTGKAQKPTVTVEVDGVTVPSSQYTVNYSNNTKVGTAKVTIKATSNATYVSSSVTKTFTITKATNPLTVSPTSKSFTVANCKKKAQTFTIKTSKAQGTVSYKSSNTKYVTVSKGKVTVKKGTPKGTYTVTVTAKGNGTYNSGSKTVTITVK